MGNEEGRRTEEEIELSKSEDIKRRRVEEKE